MKTNYRDIFTDGRIRVLVRTEGKMGEGRSFLHKGLACLPGTVKRKVKILRMAASKGEWRENEAGFMFLHKGINLIILSVEVGYWASQIFGPEENGMQ